MSKEWARGSAKLVVKGAKYCSEPWPGARVLFPRWWNGVPLTCYMLGPSGYNTENLTANLTIVVHCVGKDATFLARSRILLWYSIGVGTFALATAG